MKLQFSLLATAVLCIATISSCSTSKPATTNTPTNRQIQQWYDSRDWAEGLTIAPYAGMDTKVFYEQYHKHPEWWKTLFAYMKEHDLATLPDSKTQLMGDTVYVSVNNKVNKAFEDAQWESHRKNIDMQYIAHGAERMIVADTASLTVTQPYDSKRDVARYTGEGRSYVATPDTFFLFFPADAHRPSIKVNEEPVKKVVIKIRFAD